MKFEFDVEDIGQISDGSHTFDELYYHRMYLFSIICNTYKEKAWKSKLHHDGTMYDDYFIVGITTRYGDYTYHYHINHWNMFDVKELDNAPEYDGHKPEDLHRLLPLIENQDKFGFDNAVKYLKDGYRVKREIWADDVYIEAQYPDENSKMDSPYLYIHCKMGNVPYIVNMEELFAKDWVILK